LYVKLDTILDHWYCKGQEIVKKVLKMAAIAELAFRVCEENG